MKTNTMMRVASVLLVAVLLSTCAIAGTYAKFVSSETKSDSARVAKWDIDFDGDNDASKTFEFDLFNTVLDTKDSREEQDVAKGNGETIIAPGTKGSFDIVLTNNSEVDAEFKVEFNNTLNNVPITFTYKIDEETYTPGNFVAIDMNQTVTVTVTWEWAFTDTDETNLANQTVSVRADVTAQQVD